MNKKITDYVIDLVEVLNKQQKQLRNLLFFYSCEWYPPTQNHIF